MHLFVYAYWTGMERSLRNKTILQEFDDISSDSETDSDDSLFVDDSDEQPADPLDRHNHINLICS